MNPSPLPHPSRLPFLYGLATFVASVVGVGVFGLPYVASRVGYPIFLIELLALGGVIYAVNLLYAEIVYKTPGRHRFLGYVEHFLGRRWRNAIFAVSIISFYGGQLAYLIVGGEFLRNIFSPLFGGSTTVYTLIVFLIGSTVVFRGLSTVKRTDLVVVSLVCLLLFILLIIGLPSLTAQNLFAAVRRTAVLVPYGALMFALWGATIISEVRELSVTTERFRRVLRVGMVIIVGIYALFTLLVVGVSGAATTTEAISGLTGPLGRGVLLIGSFIGTATIFGAYTTLGISLKRVFSFDLNVPYPFSGVFTVLPPLLLFALGVKNFIAVVSFIGTVFLAIEGVTIFRMYRRSRTHTEQPGLLTHHPPLWVVDGLIILFLLGMVVGIVASLPACPAWIRQICSL